MSTVSLAFGANSASISLRCAAGLAGNRVVLLEFDRAGGLADEDGDDDESEPAEDRDLPMVCAPATHASRQVVRAA